MRITATVNGETRQADDVWEGESLLYVLRERMGLPGSEAGAVQCGFCTPGLLIATHDLLRRRGRPTDAEIREALAGNLCRCTGYENILAAVRLAADRWQDRAS
jgi:aerobic carbon-monoxide dehydrogenase small subunit